MYRSITLAAALFARLGFSREEGAKYVGVRSDTAKKWVAGKMELPAQIEADLRSYIRSWEEFCRAEAEFYSVHFKSEPYILLAEPSEEERLGWGLPNSAGFVEATLGSIAAHIDVGPKRIRIMPASELEKFIRERSLPSDHVTAALHWLGTFGDMLDTYIGTFGMTTCTELTADKLMYQLDQDQQAYSVHQRNGNPDFFVITFYASDQKYDDLAASGVNIGYGFELWLHLLDDGPSFILDPDDDSALMFRMTTGNRHCVGLGFGQVDEKRDLEGYDTTALNLHIERRLKEIFGTPKKMRAELLKKVKPPATGWAFDD